MNLLFLEHVFLLKIACGLPAPRANYESQCKQNKIKMSLTVFQTFNLDWV